MWPDLTAWGTAETALKGHDTVDEVTLANTIESLRNALRRTYGAVAFDIDGTLTSHTVTEVDARLERTIRTLLQRSVHVVLLTGRGKSTADVIHQISRPPNFSRKYLKRLHCIYDNGASRYRIELVDDVMDLIPEAIATLPQDRSLTALIDGVLGTVEADQVAQLRIRPERARVTTPSETAREEILTRLAHALTTESEPGDSRPSVGIRLARGRYQNLYTIDITPTSKGEALLRWSERIGVEPERILRIGDQGQEGGNDFDILDSPSGFSVDQSSTQLGRCHIVVDPTTGDLLRHSDATSALLSMVRLQPPLTLSPTAAAESVSRLLETEKVAWSLASRARAQSLDRFSARIASLFYGEAGVLRFERAVVSDLYDPLSGSVRLRNWEVHEAASEPILGQLFELDRFDFSARPPQARWSMYSDSGILLRGPGYYFRETRSAQHKDAISDYLERSGQFLSGAAAGVSILVDQRPTLVRLKLLLAIADNIRNFTLQLGHLAYTFETEAGSGASTVFSEALNTCLPLHSQILWDLHRGPDSDWATLVETYFGTLMAIGNSFSRMRDAAAQLGLRDAEPEIKVLRRRECDSYLENLTAVELALAKHREQAPTITARGLLVVGLCHGGIELPFIASSVGADSGDQVSAGLLSVSQYGRSAEASIEGFDSYEPMDVLQNLWLQEGSGFPNTPVLVADDNIITGRTIEQARDALIDVGADVLGAIIVRYPSVSRLQHMSFADMTQPDPDTLLTYTRGLISSGPYTRLVESYDPAAEGSDRLNDSSGLFDKARHRLERYIQKNSIARVERDG